MAFAAAIMQGTKKLSDCPYLDAETIALLEGRTAASKKNNNNDEDTIAKLQEEMSKVDFTNAAARTGATLQDGRLAINCLGKSKLPSGPIFSQIELITV